uniref:Ion transport domain-containing protein n=1 Tax=Panagrolaimus sp. JU765 TaxID=591449 RepID=A0AC34PUE8_9BILA
MSGRTLFLGHDPGSSHRPNFDPDERWSNLYREREKNHLYKWVGPRSGGELITIYEKEGEEGVVKFAMEKIEPMLYENGREPQLLKFSDYMKWKKTVNIELGLSEADNGEENSKFREHLAQWRLNKRGVDGETLIHLLLNREEPFCSEIARILMNRYPGLAKDIYLGDEMFGQSALHLAIVHDDYDTVQLLLSKGADVSARASGEFFLPEDHANNKSPNYQGYAYYGEYPLAFAACFGNKDIYDLLLQHGADPDQQDMFGNTVLHMCVINYSNSMYSYAVRHWHKPARTDIANLAGYTPLTLATKLGRKQIFEEMLELMKVEFWRFSDMTCSAYPLTTLDTIRPDGTTNYDSVLMTVINGRTPEHLDMIASEVIQRLLEDKWKLYAKNKLFLRLALLVVHLILLSVVVFTRPTEPVRIYYDEILWDDWVRLVFECFTIFSSLYFVFYQQVDELRTQGFYGYLKNLQTAPAKTIYLIANLCTLACVPCRLTRNLLLEEALLVIAVPGSWMFLLFFARSYKLTGPFVQMIYSMIAGDMIRFAIISAIFLISFSQVFYFVGKDMPIKQDLPDGDDSKCTINDHRIYTYSSFLETFVTLFRASMGGYDYEEFSCTNYEPLTKTLFVLYMFIMPIMMINILIAMMGNTYTTIITQAEKAWRQQYAQIVMVLERSVDRTKLVASQLEYSIKLQDQETRGLMVIKQTKKTRARQRRQAITNWKNMSRKVMNLINRVGTEHAMIALHSHEKLYDDFLNMKAQRSPTAVIESVHSFPRASSVGNVDGVESFDNKLGNALVMMEVSKKAAQLSPKHLKTHLPPSEHPNAVHQDLDVLSEMSSPTKAAAVNAAVSLRTSSRDSVNSVSARIQFEIQKTTGIPAKKVRGVEQLMSTNVPNVPTGHGKFSGEGMSAIPPIPSKISPISSSKSTSPVVHSSPSKATKPSSANGFALNETERANQHVFRMTEFTPPPRAVEMTGPRIRSDLFRKKESPTKSSASSANSNSRL